VSGVALDTVGRILGRKVGLRIEASMRDRLERCLEEAARDRNESVSAYSQRLDRDPHALQALLDRVTVQETWFFRDAGQFTTLARDIVPQLQEPAVIWSAGCANGQEPYSLAITLEESNCRDWQVVATDVSNRALARTRAGRYLERELRGLDARRREKYFHPVGMEWEVSPHLRERVSVRRHNLVTDAPPFEPGHASVVFCRNVLIYFRREDSLAFLKRLHSWLPEGGHLFLGYSESLWHVTDLFELVRLDESYVYRRPPLLQARPPQPRSAELGPAPARRPRVVPPRPEPTPVPQLLASGEAALSRSDLPAASAAFRKAAYLDPGNPIAHLCLGLSLEAALDHDAARRAYSAARAALERGNVSAAETVLEGYSIQELRRLLDDKLQRPRGSP
jgi:chemotaxis methyl-accepting protein methylase